MKFNFEKFCKQYPAFYNFLYNFEKHVANEQEMIDWFDEKIENDECFKKFVGEFVDYRRDFISSDREAAAFAYVIFAQVENGDAVESEDPRCTYEWDVEMWKTKWK